MTSIILPISVFKKNEKYFFGSALVELHVKSDMILGNICQP